MAEEQSPLERNVETKGGNYSENIDGHNIQANTVIINEQHHPYTKNSSFLLPELEKEVLLGKKEVFQNGHKYSGRLVSISIELYEHCPPQKTCVKLSISFGTPEIQIPKYNPFKLKNETIDIKFGIKNGDLCLALKNGSMPLNQRETLTNKEKKWEGTPIGSAESPTWEFRINDESLSEQTIQTLHGNIKNEVLGILDLLDLSTCCEVNAYFHVNINRINIAIIDFDDGETNKKQKETKIALLLKYLKAEIENYLSKEVIKYEPTPLS